MNNSLLYIRLPKKKRNFLRHKIKHISENSTIFKNNTFTDQYQIST